MLAFSRDFPRNDDRSQHISKGVALCATRGRNMCDNAQTPVSRHVHPAGWRITMNRVAHFAHFAHFATLTNLDMKSRTRVLPAKPAQPFRLH